MNNIKITVRFHGIVADQIGTQEESINIPEHSTVAEVINERYMSKFNGQNQVSAYAINNQFSNENDIIQDGDVIDLMPPFAGG
ncbi:MAG: molybdopterin converting factor small subunit [Patiriisocius sp.]|jgi:molybdopterin converting factor small subunit